MRRGGWVVVAALVGCHSLASSSGWRDPELDGELGGQPSIDEPAAGSAGHAASGAPPSVGGADNHEAGASSLSAAGLAGNAVTVGEGGVGSGGEPGKAPSAPHVS